MTHTLKGVPSYDGYECALCHQRFATYQYEIVSTLPCPATVAPPAEDTLIEQAYVPPPSKFDEVIGLLVVLCAIGGIFTWLWLFWQGCGCLK